MNTKFSCVPLTPAKVWNVSPDLITAHTMIKASGLPNFLGLRIPVATNLNIPAWRKHLCDDFDQQLVDLIEFSFPLDFDRTKEIESTLQIHASSRNYPTHVDKYLEEKLLHGAILGPLNDIPFDLHIFLLMTRDKSSSDCRRT